MGSINPTLDVGGGQILPRPPSIFCSGALNIDLRGTRLWYNPFYIDNESPESQETKGVPKKIRVSFWTQGSKLKNSKVIQTF